MSDPFYQPEDETARAAIEAIGEDLALFDDMPDGPFPYIMDFGKRLKDFPREWEIEENRIQGCQAKVWFVAQRRDGQIFLAGSSDSPIVRGLVALVFRIYSGRSRQEILATSPQFLKDLGIIKSFTTGRGNGVGAMVERIQEMARAET